MIPRDTKPEEVLAALYNHSKPQGMGFLTYQPGDMTVEEAADLIDLNAKSTYFDYVKGRVIKTDVGSRPLNFTLYDRDNGPGAGEAAVLDFLSAPQKKASR